VLIAGICAMLALGGHLLVRGLLPQEDSLPSVFQALLLVRRR
jgi:hypothetical protein